MKSYSRETLLYYKDNSNIEINKDQQRKWKDIKMAIERELSHRRMYPGRRRGRPQWRNRVKNKNIEDNKFSLVVEKLNVLADKNYDVISSLIIEVIKNDTKMLSKCIHLIYQRAIKQPRYSKLYSQLIYLLNSDFPEVKGFVLNEYNLIIGSFKKNIEKTDDNYVEYVKEKNKFKGSFRLIGYLYLINMFTVNHIETIYSLLFEELENEDCNKEEYVESIVEFINITGAYLEKEEKSEYIKELFMDKCQEISKDRKTYKARSRFIMMDCMDRKDWI